MFPAQFSFQSIEEWDPSWEILQLWPDLEGAEKNGKEPNQQISVTLSYPYKCVGSSSFWGEIPMLNHTMLVNIH